MENNSKSIYNSDFVPYINKVGQITNWLGVIFSFGPAVVIAVIFGIVPPADAIFTGFLAIAGAVGIMWFVEPISYFPIVGVAGTYMAFISGNISNMRIPCAAIAQKTANVEPGTEEGSIIATLGMAVSIIVNTTVLTIGVALGSAILSQLPKEVTQALNYLLPSLFGAIFVQFALKKLKLAPIALAIAIALTLLVKSGALGFLPGGASYVTTLGSVFGTMAIGSLMYKKNW